MDLVLEHFSDFRIFSANSNIRQHVRNARALISQSGFEKIFDKLKESDRIEGKIFLTFLSWYHCPQLQIPFIPTPDEFRGMFRIIVEESPLFRARDISTLSTFAVFVLSPDFLPEFILNDYARKLDFKIKTAFSFSIAQIKDPEKAYSVTFCCVSLSISLCNNFLLPETKDA
jgi:hypothetical protein